MSRAHPHRGSAADGPLRIGLVYDDSLDRHGGIAQYISTLARELQARGHVVTFLVGESRADSRQGAEVRSLSRNLRVRFNGNSLTTPLVSRRREIVRTVAAGGFDVLHVQVPYSPVMAGRVIAAAASSTAVIGTCHVFSERLLPRTGARVLRLLSAQTLGRFDSVLSVSAPAAIFARELLGLDAGRIIPNMVDIKAMQVAAASRPRSAAEGPSIVFVGSLVPRKGVDGLLAAFGRLLPSHPGARLNIAGEGRLDHALRRQAASLAIQGRVRFLGAVSEVEKAILLREADVACFPSRFGESFGIVLLEAMAAGAGIVVGGDNPGHRSVLRRAEVIVDPDDAEHFANVFARLLADAGLRREIHAEQATRVLRYDSGLVTNRIIGAYREAIAARTRANAAPTNDPFPLHA